MRGVKIDRAKLEAVMQAKSQQAARKGADAYRERVRQEILTSGRVRTGGMFLNIEVTEVAPKPGEARVAVTPKSRHFRYQNDGTRGSVAGPGRVLRFKPKGSSMFIFRRRTRGVPAARFLEKAKAKMRAEDFT